MSGRCAWSDATCLLMARHVRLRRGRAPYPALTSGAYLLTGIVLPFTFARMLSKAQHMAMAMGLLLQPVAWVGAQPSNAPTAAAEAKVRWRHPAGLVTDETIAEVKAKLAEDWARRVYDDKRKQVEPWLKVASPKLAEVFPKKRGNVYHNFSCPQDRCRLTFDPFDAHEFKCPICNKVFAPETDAGVYPPKTRYHDTMYGGWINLFHFAASEAAEDLGVFSRVEPADSQKYAGRAIELLLLYADVLPTIPTRFGESPQMSVLLTYHREGDSKVLHHLAVAYELVRDRMTPEQRSRVERLVLQRMLDDLMLERIYTQNHNNLYYWHRTVLQVALALEREALFDWSFGYGPWSPEQEPAHSSIQELLATHFKPDGAFWEMCSGYHLYPLQALCELAVLSRHLTAMDANRFPARRYDLTARANPGYAVIQNALHWFVSLAPPDRVMPTVGDSMAPRGSLVDYYATAEVGYRFYGLKAVGDYTELREGKRNWAALLYGAPQIVQTPQPTTSSHLSSGWVSLRNEWQGNRVWVGLNALIPGGGHQHADRLTLLSFSHGQLLALEKATPYNEETTRELGTLSPSHNTVTVDLQSQKQGEALKGDEIPKVALFVTGPIAHFAELHGDQIYPQTRVYRRCVALIEDFYVDFFRVEGGTNFDWMLHHAGAAPNFFVPAESVESAVPSERMRLNQTDLTQNAKRKTSRSLLASAPTDWRALPMSEGNFAPPHWLFGGSRRVRQATVDGAWEARWSVAGVTSRLTMLGATDTTVYGLETYPVDNAVITPRNLPCQTLCVRRRGGQAAFLAVGDAWRDEPNLQSVRPAKDGSGLLLRTKSHTYHLLFTPGGAMFPDGVSLNSDAAFAVLRDRDAAMLVQGTQLDVKSAEGSLIVRLDKPASLSAEFVNGAVKKTISGNIQYDTYGGVDHWRSAPEVKVTVTGDLWQTSKPR